MIDKTFRNDLGYQVASPTMNAAIMGDVSTLKPYLSAFVLNCFVKDLKKFNIPDPASVPDNPNLFSSDFTVEPLLGSDIAKHFELMGSSLFASVKEQFIDFSLWEYKKTLFPKHFKSLNNHWNYYNPELDRWEKIAAPQEETIIFDCETFYLNDNHALLGTVLSEKGYYLWVHESFLNPDLPYKKRFIDLGDRVKNVIGVNVSFDAARVEDSYLLDSPRYNYLDTSSLFNVVHGLTSGLRILYKACGWNEKLNPYCNYGSPASLIDSYNFYFRSTHPMDVAEKKIRDVFVKSATIKEMVDINRQDDVLYNYALKDCYYTFKIFSKVLPEYLKYAPSEVSWSALMILGNPRPALDNNWYQWVDRCEKMYFDSLGVIKQELSKLAADIHQDFLNDALDPVYDPWLNHLDWGIDFRVKKIKTRIYKIYLENGDEALVTIANGKPVADSINNYVAKQALLPLYTKTGRVKAKLTEVQVTEIPFNPKTYNMAAWYAKTKAKELSNKSQDAHTLLKLSWKGNPIYKAKEQGYCYDDPEKGVTKVPHKKQDGSNVGCILSKEYIKYYKQGILTSPYKSLDVIMHHSERIAYWTSARSRVKNLMTHEVPNPLDGGNITLMGAAQVAPHNTVSGRTGQNLLNTVPSPKKEKIGTELKSMFQAPKGWKIVGGDLDSNEAQIFGLFADSRTGAGISGTTPVGYTLINGSKENQDDVHWALSKLVGISRSDAKTINYGLNYGAGKKTISLNLKKSNPLMDDLEIDKIVDNILAIKKGNKDGDGKYWKGGSDSEGFNHIIDQLKEDNPATFMLGTKMSQAIIPRNDTFNKTLMSIQNWVIQASGVDFLKCMLVGCEYLNLKYNLGAILMITLHDEFMYLVPEANAEKFAACFLMAHIWTWALAQFKANVYDLPLQRIFISGVYVGNRWCKEIGSNVTVSNEIESIEGKEYKHQELLKILEQLTHSANKNVRS